MTEFYLVVLVIGGSVLLLGIFSDLLKRWGIPDALLVLLLGVALGPQGMALLNPKDWGDSDIIVEQASRLALAVGLMGVALRIPPDFLTRNWRSLAVVLVLGMVWMWVSSSLLVGLIVGLPLWTALLAGAIITPTDPIIASAIVTGQLANEKLPSDLRHLISGESGANDGLALPIVLLPVLFLTQPAGEAALHWLLRVLLWEVCGAIALGLAIGSIMGLLLKWSEQRKWIEDPSMLAFSTALALFTVAVVKLMKADGILAVFAAGLTLDRIIGAGQRNTEERVVEGVDRFFVLPIFALIGITIPWGDWQSLGWRAPVLVTAVLLLRRLPVLLLLTGRVWALPKFSDALFVGWFGPVGVAAVFYASLAMRRAGTPEVWTVASLIVCSSIVVHGLSAMPLTRLYGRAITRT